MLHLLLIYMIVGSCFCVEIKVDSKRVINVVGDRFVSVTLDTNIMIRHWQHFKPSSAKVVTLARALSPSYLRFGGTDADLILFENGNSNSLYETESAKVIQIAESDNLQKEDNYYQLPDVEVRSKRDIGYIFEEDRKYDENFTMTASLYDELHKFTSAAGFDLVFDLNVMLRSNNGWLPGNAQKLMEYTVKKGYPMAGWELGNEPNADFRQWGRRIEPQQLAKDYNTLKAMVSNFTALKDGIILGPSTTQLNKKSTIDYFISFLESGGGKAVTSVCFHQYYVDKRTATANQFIDPEILNLLIDEVITGYNIKKQTTKNTQLWIGETSSAWGAGAEGLSNRYIAGFMWLDKLGISAKLGVDVVVRQALYGGHYSLLHQKTRTPNPDYWLTLLFKKLVGGKVLSVTSPDFKGKLRAYAHCAKIKGTNYRPGSVVVYAMNLNSHSVNLTFSDIFHSESDLHVYLLHPEDDDLLSSTVLLNGKPLKMLSDTKLPSLLPRIQSSPVLLPAHTFGFVVIPNANIQVCL